jgi:hypothetical protein
MQVWEAFLFARNFTPTLNGRIYETTGGGITIETNPPMKRYRQKLKTLTTNSHCQSLSESGFCLRYDSAAR